MNLRTFYRITAPLLGISEHELYDFERALRAEGYMKAGRPGPGGGIPARPGTVASIIMAVLASDTKRAAGQTAREFGLLPPIGDTLPLPNGEFSDYEVGHFGEGACGLTGAPCFGVALEFILSSFAFASRVVEISVYRHQRRSVITYHDEAHKRRFGHFGAKGHAASAMDVAHASLRGELDPRGDVPLLEVVAKLHGGALAKMAIDLSEANDAEWTGSA